MKLQAKSDKHRHFGPLGMWGTLQCRWVREEAPTLTVLLSQIVESLTPLVAPALLTWGALAVPIGALKFHCNFTRQNP